MGELKLELELELEEEEEDEKSECHEETHLAFGSIGAVSRSVLLFTASSKHQGYVNVTRFCCKPVH